ncbi:MAG: DNA polymerase beta [Planctomycetes bacterium GWE2_41_14]|nr:MAG: DNA polymerase beta [Planctomycetes bacterium GWE2_41_14]
MKDISIEKILNEVIKRILSVVRPKKIILFGSAVREEMHANSDIDLLVVIPSGQHRRRTAQSIYLNLIGLGFAADVVVVTEDDIEQFKENIGMIIKQALDEGRVLYAA